MLTALALHLSLLGMFSACSDTGDDASDDPVSTSAAEETTVSAPATTPAVTPDITSPVQTTVPTESTAPQTEPETSAAATTQATEATNPPAQTTVTSPPPVTAAPPTAAGTAATTSPPPAAPAVSYVREPQASGTVVYQNAKAYIDASNASEGYFMAKFTGGGDKRIRLRLVKDGAVLYTSELNNAGRFETYSFTASSGSYQIFVYENVTGTQYAQVLAQDLSVTLTSELLPYLYPNQTVNFSGSSAAVKKAAELCAGLSTDAQKTAAIYGYIVQTISYDRQKAADAGAGRLVGYTPSPDATLSSGSGICYDYASLFAAMLRSQNIPAKLVKGNVAPDGLYHAWNLVYLQSDGTIAPGISAGAGGWKLLDTTFAAGGADTGFLNNSGNYTATSFF